MSDSTLLKVPIKWASVMRHTHMTCGVSTLIDTILIRIVANGAHRPPLGTHGLGVGKSADEGGSWYAMTWAMGLLDQPQVAPL